ncbi:MAG: T9SS type A sorting domain-containing protein [Flavobacteriaceae bacterium]|jgi:hypothetical protein
MSSFFICFKNIKLNFKNLLLGYHSIKNSFFISTFKLSYYRNDQNYCRIFYFLSALDSPIYSFNALLKISPQNTQSDSLQFSIFPNPVKDKILNIESTSNSIKHIQIYNVLGEKKMEIDTYENIIFLEKLNTGIYMFVLKQEGQKGLKRLVVP